MNDEVQDHGASEPNAHEAASLILDLRRRALKQLFFGLTWWSASAFAMYFAMASPDSSLYWYGGALGALFHWYRAFRLFQATWQSVPGKLLPREIFVILATVIVVSASTVRIVPEYFRIDAPTIGTCWAETKDGSFSPVACWSKDAFVRTIGLVSNSDFCPEESAGFFDPSAWESRYSCLGSVR